MFYLILLPVWKVNVYKLHHIPHHHRSGFGRTMMMWIWYSLFYRHFTSLSIICFSKYLTNNIIIRHVRALSCRINSQVLQCTLYNIISESPWRPLRTSHKSLIPCQQASSPTRMASWWLSLLRIEVHFVDKERFRFYARLIHRLELDKDNLSVYGENT